jgi:hypothetical protein
MISAALRREAWRLLKGDSAILDVARDVSRILRDTGVPGAVIGGVAVVLHGYVRTTIDVDVFVPDRADDFASAMRAAGYRFRRARKEFVKHGVPVHLVFTDQIGAAPRRLTEIDGVATVSLADLINMKLYSGTRSVLRAIDLADVIGLIRNRRLTGAFAARIDKPVRAEFRKLVRAVSQAG